jgi:hypothetical protein
MVDEHNHMPKLMQFYQLDPMIEIFLKNENMHEINLYICFLISNVFKLHNQHNNIFNRKKFDLL